MPLQSGTYARESGGSALLFHSPVRWNDASYALSRWRNHETTSSLSEWRRVDDESERYALEAYLCGRLFPGENVEVQL